MYRNIVVGLTEPLECSSPVEPLLETVVDEGNVYRNDEESGNG